MSEDTKAPNRIAVPEADVLSVIGTYDEIMLQKSRAVDVRRRYLVDEAEIFGKIGVLEGEYTTLVRALARRLNVPDGWMFSLRERSFLDPKAGG